MVSNDLVMLVTRAVMENMKRDGVSVEDCFDKTEPLQVPIGVSNRHVHISREHLDILFGVGYELTKKGDLKQPGQYASNELVTIRGPKGEFDKVRILGPIRPQSQVEISKTDSFRLGIKPPLRESGILEGTPGLELVGPKGIVKLEYGAIVAHRHIHMTPEQSRQAGLKDKDIVDVETCGQRRGVLGNVLVRVSDKFALEMHVDVDEANACGLGNNDVVRVVKTNS